MNESLGDSLLKLHIASYINVVDHVITKVLIMMTSLQSILF